MNEIIDRKRETSQAGIAESEVRRRAFAMPLTSPAYPPGPYRFRDREFMIITYRTDPEKLKALVPEPLEMDEHEVAAEAPSQIGQLDPMHLAIWISAAPDPQRSALALFYLDEFDYREILDLAELKLNELSRFLGNGRQQLQAWLDAKFPQQIDV